MFTQVDGLLNKSVESIFQDREGNVWIGGTNGLERFRDYAVATISEKQGLASPTATSVLAAADGSVWVGTSNGLNRWKDGRITVYRKPSGLPGDSVGALYNDPAGQIWISAHRALVRFENEELVPFKAVEPASSAQTPIVRDNAGSLWISAEPGLDRVSDGRVVEQVPAAKLPFDGALATILAADLLRGGLWLAAWQTDRVVWYRDGQLRESYGPPEGLGGGRVNALSVDSAKTLWAATDGGLSRIQNGRVATLTAKNGLPCDIVHGVVEDTQRSLWIYMACGLVRILRPELEAWIADPNRRIQATVLDVSDGVETHSDLQQHSPRITLAADGKIWFVPLGGVGVVDPLRLPFNKLPPPVHIEQITADGKLRWQNLWGAPASTLRLPALIRTLEIDYTALSLTVPEKVRFKYKLEGYDVDWQDPGDRRQAFYTNLSPRTYRFRVMASNNSGVWNEAGDVMGFSIAPAYYQTWWFLTLCGAAFLALLGALYRHRLNRIAWEYNLRLEERVNERTRIASELHDTLLQSFQGLMLLFATARQMLPARPADAAETLDGALGRADRAIVESREAIQGMRSSTELTNDLARALKAVGAELASDLAPDLRSEQAPEFAVKVNGASRDIHPILRDEIYKIAREAIRNAFRHAHARRIEAELTYSDKTLRLCIRDDGRGSVRTSWKTAPPAIMVCLECANAPNESAVDWSYGVERDEVRKWT